MEQKMAEGSETSKKIPQQVHESLIKLEFAFHYYHKQSTQFVHS
jgi:hypothetical protein